MIGNPPGLPEKMQVQAALKALDFTRPEYTKALLEPFLLTDIFPSARSFLRTLIQACDRYPEPLFHWLFYKARIVNNSPTGPTSPSILDPSAASVCCLIELMGNRFISLKGLPIDFDLTGRSILPVADFSGADLQGIRYATAIFSSLFPFRFNEQDTLIRCPLFSFSNLNELIFLTLKAVSQGVSPEDPSQKQIVDLIKTSLYLADPRSLAQAISLSPGQTTPERQKIFSGALNEENALILKNHLVIAARLMDFLREGSPSSHTHSFLRAECADTLKYPSLMALYQDFSALQNPFSAPFIHLQHRLSRKIDQKWKQYQASSGYRMAQVSHFLLLSLLLAWMAYTQNMPQLLFILPFVFATLLYMNIPSEQALTGLTPFIMMPLRLIPASYLASILVEEKILGLERPWPPTKSAFSMVAITAMGLDILLKIIDAYCLAKEAHRYKQKIHSEKKIAEAPLKEIALYAALRHMLQQASWMLIPYLSSEGVMILLGSKQLTPLFRMALPALLTDIKFALSTTLALHHYRKMQGAKKGIVRDFQKQQCLHFCIESSLAFISVLVSPSFTKQSLVAALNPKNPSLEAFSQDLVLWTQPIEKIKVPLNGSPCLFVFFGQDESICRTQRIGLEDTLPTLQRQLDQHDITAKPLLFSSGILKAQHQEKPFDLFNSRQNNTDNLLLAARLIPNEHIPYATQAMGSYPSAITQFMQFMWRTTTAERRAAPHI